MFIGFASSDWKDNHFTSNLLPPARKLDNRYNPNSSIGKKYRYSNAHQYTHVRILAAVQLEKPIAEDFEIQTRKVLQQEKGLVYVPSIASNTSYFPLQLKFLSMNLRLNYIRENMEKHIKFMGGWINVLGK